MKVKVFNNEEVNIDVNKYTYLPNDEPQEGWIPFVRECYLKLKGTINNPKKVCIVGVGSGLEGIFMDKLFNPDFILGTDIEEGVLELARNNIYRNSTSTNKLNVSCVQSDLFESLDKSLKFDLIHENLPNLSLSEEDDIEGPDFASFHHPVKQSKTPPFIIENMLSLHYSFLMNAAEHLEDKGHVLCFIGGRIDYKHIERMFLECGYIPAIVHRGIVRQFNATDVIKGYKKAERQNDKKYRFLRYEDCKEIDMENAKNITFMDAKMIIITIKKPQH